LRQDGRRIVMAPVFISLAIEDAELRTLPSGQTSNAEAAFEFTYHPVKEDWKFAWKADCRANIMTASGVEH